jgi:hypothetical protein
MTKPGRHLRDDEKAKVSHFFPVPGRTRRTSLVDRYRAEDRELGRRSTGAGEVHLVRCATCREWLTGSSKARGACNECGAELATMEAPPIRGLPRPGAAE